MAVFALHFRRIGRRWEGHEDLERDDDSDGGSSERLGH